MLDRAVYLLNGGDPTAEAVAIISVAQSLECIADLLERLVKLVEDNNVSIHAYTHSGD
jgi:hypothetical protein